MGKFSKTSMELRGQSLTVETKKEVQGSRGFLQKAAAIKFATDLKRDQLIQLSILDLEHDISNGRYVVFYKYVPKPQSLL